MVFRLLQVLSELDNPTEHRVQATLTMTVVRKTIARTHKQTHERAGGGVWSGGRMCLALDRQPHGVGNIRTSVVLASFVALHNSICVTALMICMTGVAALQGFASLVYLLVAVPGYLQFSNEVCGTITESFETLGRQDRLGNHTSVSGSVGSVASTWVTVAQILVVISLGAGFPTALWPCRDAICFVLFAGSATDSQKSLQESAAVRTCVCVLVWGSSCGVALAVAASGEHGFQLEDVLELVGATVSSTIAFVLPFICFTQLRYGITRGKQVPLPIWRRILTTLPGLLSVAGVALTLFATYMVLRNDHGGTITAAARDAREAVCGRAAVSDLPNSNDGST